MKEAALLGCLTEINTWNRMQDITKFSLKAQCTFCGGRVKPVTLPCFRGLVLLESFTPAAVLTRAQRVLGKSGGGWPHWEKRSISQGRTAQL